ncbi:MAG TPA: Rv3235 family protein [Pilimelia sp.]|nr:Rv3235 family protein [Pilimelia sp.]
MTSALVGRPRVGRSFPPIRLRPAPPVDPPFDDDAAPRTWADPRAEQLLLEWSPRAAGPAAASRRATDGGASSGGSTGTGTPPESRVAARRFAGACLEILNGYRPAAHLRPLTMAADAAGVLEQLGLARERVRVLRESAGRSAPRTQTGTAPRTQTGAIPRGQARAIPGATSRVAVGTGAVAGWRPAAPQVEAQPAGGGGPRRAGAGPGPVRLLRLRVCEPRSGVAEAAAVLSCSGRAWALAFRLEHRRGHWLCTTAVVV